MKVLVPLDGTELSEGMLRPASRLAPGGEVLLVRVVHPPACSHDRQASHQAQAYLEDHSKELERLGISTRWCLEEGNPAERILLVADERHPDYVVMATHGRSGTARRVEGSVAEEVLRQSSTPLFLCNPHSVPWARSRRFERLLVAHDGSDLADGILPHVARFAKAFGSTVTLLHVVGRRSRRGFQGELTRGRDVLEKAGIRAQTHFVVGSAAEVILEEAQGFDVVCLTTHGRSGLSRWLFGSVAEEVVRRCTRPLLLLRHEPR